MQTVYLDGTHLTPEVLVDIGYCDDLYIDLSQQVIWH
jgi:uncharacterized membrane protein YkvA (DUF1232 family)